MALTAAGLQRALVDRGYPLHVAAGITANAQHESGFDPGAIGDQGTSIGLFQWHGPRADALRTFARDGGRDWRDPGVQLDFLGHELAGGLRKRLDATDGPETASRLFTLDFERPANAQAKAAERARTARELGSGSGRPAYDPFEGWTTEAPQRPAPAADPFEGWTVAGSGAAPKAFDPFEGWTTAPPAAPAAPQTPPDPFEGWSVAAAPQAAPAAAQAPQAAPSPAPAPQPAQLPETDPQKLQAARTTGTEAMVAELPPSPEQAAQHWERQARGPDGRWSGGFLPSNPLACPLPQSV